MVMRADHWKPPLYPPYSLRDDIVLRRKTAAALRDRGVSISLADGFLVREGADVRDRVGDLGIMADLGATRINTVSMDPDLNRSIDQFGVLAALAAAAGLETTMELCPVLTVADLPTALAVIKAVGRPDFRLLVDTMHFARAGVGADDIAALDPDVIGYAQISDTTIAAADPDYMREAITERMVPGTGELPLPDMLAALPRDVVIGIEIPLYSEAKAGVGPHERVGRCVTATRDLLASIDEG
jgi:sugar phosphate isomerase/epimerase